MKLELQQNKKYKAKISLGFGMSWAPNTMVMNKLIAAGFKDVHVQGDGSERTATGIWPGKTQIVDLPKQVKDVQRL